MASFERKESQTKGLSYNDDNDKKYYYNRFYIIKIIIVMTPELFDHDTVLCF